MRLSEVWMRMRAIAALQTSSVSRGDWGLVSTIAESAEIAFRSESADMTRARAWAMVVARSSVWRSWVPSMKQGIGAGVEGVERNWG
jgi:hypothetical protein